MECVRLFQPPSPLTELEFGVRIRENLDYIQGAGFTAGGSFLSNSVVSVSSQPLVWISPVNQNYDGPRTVYGDAYHGYWIQDLSKLNNRFGTADDLKALIQELHRREMWAENLPRTSA
jgi:alpha-amylase